MIEEVLHAGFFAIGAIAVLDEDANDCGWLRGQLRRGYDNAGVAGEVFMAGDSAEGETVVDARLERFAFEQPPAARR